MLFTSRLSNGLSRNALILITSNFFLEMGRTLPHSILTLFLLSQGNSLTDIAFVKIIQKMAEIVSILPIGIISDIFSRKKLYIISIILLFISYFCFCFFSHNLLILSISYALYGFSMPLRYDTLESDVIFEYKTKDLNVKHYVTTMMYTLSIAGIIGGAIGGFLYSNIGGYIYIVSLVLLTLSLICSIFFNSLRENKSKQHDVNKIKLSDISNVFRDLFNSRTYVWMIFSICILTLFIQSFFHYWQILYKEINIDTKYFGLIYVSFHICNVIGTLICKHININKIIVGLVLILLPFFYSFIYIDQKLLLYVFPLIVTSFYVYHQHMNIIRKELAFLHNTSTYFAIINILETIIGMINLLVMTKSVEHFGVINSYMGMLILFSILSWFCYSTFRRYFGKAYKN